MKLTTRSEYALLALLCLARHGSDEPMSGERIAQEQNIPPKFLQQILFALKRAHYVHSSKGPNGGYRLAKPASQISIAEIVRLLDGALAPTESVSTYFYDSTPIEREDGLLNVFREIRDYVAKKMEKTTLADVL